MCAVYSSQESVSEILDAPTAKRDRAADDLPDSHTRRQRHAPADGVPFCQCLPLALLPRLGRDEFPAHTSLPCIRAAGRIAESQSLKRSRDESGNAAYLTSL